MPELPTIDPLWNYADPVGTERVFLDLLGRLPEGVSPAYRAELLTQIARARALQRRFSDADRTLDEAEALLHGMGRAAVRALLERGRIRRDLAQTPQALALFHEAYDLARSSGEQALAMDAAHMLGYASEPHEAVRWNQEAILTAQGSEDPALRRWLGTLHMNLGKSLLELNRCEEARAAYADAERYRREAGRVVDAWHARAGQARSLRLAGRAAEALAAMEEILPESGVDPTCDGYIHEEAGEALLVLGRTGEARDHFARAYPVLAADPWFPPTDTARLERIRRLGGAPATETENR